VENAFIAAGLASLIAAIVGGGLKAFGIEVPVLASRIRQLVLGIVGLLLLALGLGVVRPPKPANAPKSVFLITGYPTDSSIGPHQGTYIHVRVTTDHGTAVTGAMVSIREAGGGKFGLSGSNTVTGMTDDRGEFQADWAPAQDTQLTSNMRYEMQATVTNDGATIGMVQISVNVHP
jgi:hypothetical protein